MRGLLERYSTNPASPRDARERRRVDGLGVSEATTRNTVDRLRSSELLDRARPRLNDPPAASGRSCHTWRRGPDVVTTALSSFKAGA
jgi:hypothetical protein